MRVPDAILVLGARVAPGGKPTRALQKRLDAAIEASHRWPHARIVVCGGCLHDGYVEADVMARVLIDSGVAEDRVVRDRLSLTTLENLREGARAIGASRFFAIVTSDWHLRRALSIARALGLEVLGVPAESDESWPRRMMHAVREPLLLLLSLYLARRA